MNFLIKRVAVFFFLVFTLFACEEPGDIGLEIKNPGQSFGVLYTDTVSVQTSTILVDSVQTLRTANNNYLMGGQYIDPQFGTIVAKSFFQVIPRDTLLSLGTSPVLDSVVLFLHENYSYGDTNQIQQIAVHLLQDSVQFRSYYSTEVIPYQVDPVGSVALKATPKKTDDTLKIRLDPSVGTSLITLNGSNIETFLDNFFGFALLPGTAENATVINFDASPSTGTRLRLYYKDASSTSQKTYDFAINYAFNNIGADKTGTPLANLQTLYQPLPSSVTEEETFLQGGTGVMTKVDLSNLIKLRDSRTIRFNQVFLTVQPVTNKTGTYTTPPSQLILYRANSSDNPLRNSNGVYIPAESPPISQGTPVSYDAVNKYYKIDITQYVQQLIATSASQVVNYTVYLSVPSFTLNTYYSTNNEPANLVAPSSSLESSVSRLVLGSQQHPTNKLKLEVYYTEVK